MNGSPINETNKNFPLIPYLPTKKKYINEFYYLFDGFRFIKKFLLTRLWISTNMS